MQIFAFNSIFVKLAVTFKKKYAVKINKLTNLIPIMNKNQRG